MGQHDAAAPVPIQKSSAVMEKQPSQQRSQRRIHRGFSASGGLATCGLILAACHIITTTAIPGILPLISRKYPHSRQAESFPVLSELCPASTCRPCPALMGGQRAAAEGHCEARVYGSSSRWCLPALQEIRGARASLLFNLAAAAEGSRTSKASQWLSSVFRRAPRVLSSADMGHFTLHAGNKPGLLMAKPADGKGLPGGDLPTLGDFTSCAVVGSSSSLFAAAQGPQIDNHTAVLRFNQAPTRGFEGAVGSRTTLRLQNSHAAGFSELGSREICLLRLSSTKKKNKGGQDIRSLRPSGCRVVQLSPQFEAYRRTLWFNQAEPGAAKWSSGFMGIALAVNLCSSVSLYGFDFGSEYYFDKDHRKKGQGKEIATGHPWALEKSCTAELATSGVLSWAQG